MIITKRATEHAPSRGGAVPVVVPEPSQARIASAPASQCPPGRFFFGHFRKCKVTANRLSNHDWYDESSGMAEKYLRVPISPYLSINGKATPTAWSTWHQASLFAQYDWWLQAQSLPRACTAQYSGSILPPAQNTNLPIASQDVSAASTRWSPQESPWNAGCHPSTKSTKQVELSHSSNAKDGLHVHVGCVWICVNDNDI